MRVALMLALAAAAPAQQSDDPFAELRRDPVSSETIARYVTSRERMIALLDHVWEHDDLDGGSAFRALLLSLRHSGSTGDLRVRFRRAAVLNGRRGLRLEVTRRGPRIPYEGAAWIEALRRDGDDAMIAAQVRGAHHLGSEWLAVLLDRVGRDLELPRCRETVFQLAGGPAGGRGGIAGLAYERVSNGKPPGTLGSRGIPSAPYPMTPKTTAVDTVSMLQRRECAIVVGYSYRGEAAASARVLLDGKCADEWPLERGGGQMEFATRPLVRHVPPFEAPFDCREISLEIDQAAVGRFEFFGWAFVEPYFFDVRSHGLCVPFVKDGEAAVKIENAAVSSGWGAAVVVSGDTATITFEVPETFDLAHVRNLHLDHWSPEPASWVAELNGKPLVTLMSQRMPRPAKVPRLKRGAVVHGANVLVLRRGNGTAPLHLEALWLWP